MLRIDLAPFTEGVHRVTLDVEAQDVGLDPDLFAGIRVDVLLDVQHQGRVLVTLQARATATLECDRTLVLFQEPIEGSYRMLFAPDSLARSREEEDIEEVRLLEPSERVIDVTDAVRDTLLLAVPARKVAPGAEDIDLPTVFGVPDDEPAVDPRWEALRPLRSDSPEA